MLDAGNAGAYWRRDGDDAPAWLRRHGGCVILICVGDPRKGLGSVGCFVLFGLVPARALCRWTAVGVEVERPQRSEDERPRDRRGSAVELAGLRRRKDVVVQAICDLS